MVSPLALLPDIDILFGVHRSMTHSIPVILAVFIVAYVVLRGMAPSHLDKLLPSTLTLLSHPLIDTFEGFTPLLWPLHNQSIYLATDISISSASLPYIHFSFKTLFSPKLFPTVIEIPWPPPFTDLGLVVTALALTVSLVVVSAAKKLR